MLVSIIKAQSLYEINSHVGSNTEKINTSIIDSITYEISDDSYNQIIWMNGNKSSAAISPKDSVCFNERYELYPIISEDIETGLVTNNGNYSFISNKLEDCDDCRMIVISDSANNDDLIIFADSLGFIRYIKSGDNDFSIIYGKNDFLVYVNENLLKRGSYEDLHIEDYYASSIENKDNLSIRKVCAFLCAMFDFIGESHNSSVLRTFSKELFNGRFITESERNSKTIKTYNIKRFKSGYIKNYLDFLQFCLETMQKIARFIVFGNTEIETLSPQKRKINNYELGCKVTYGANGMLGDVFVRDYNISIVLKKSTSEKVVRTETRTSASSTDNTYYMPFDNLNLDTKYKFFPRLDAYFWMPDKPERLSVWEIGTEYKFPPFLFLSMGASKEGESKSFKVGHPACSIEEAYAITDKSATVDCHFSDLPEGSACYVRVSCNDGGIQRVSCSATEGKQSVQLSGLTPNTMYICQPIVEFHGKEYPADNTIDFTTDLPDISGTWTCKETHYKFNNANYPYYTTYTITLNEDGSVSWSNSSKIISGSWTFSKNGNVELEIMDVATQTANSGKKWRGNVDSLDNPQKITGYTNRWNYNQNGFFDGDAVEFEMTR